MAQTAPLSARQPLMFGSSQKSQNKRRDNTASFASLSQQLFQSPAASGRKITAGFSYVQRIGKSGTSEVWFPDALRQELEQLTKAGTKLGAEHFPAEWAAVRQFELLHESGNYKVFDMRSDHITRTLKDLASHMRAGGFRITVATLGRYVEPKESDDLAILDKRLQKRIANLIHMMYLDEQSDSINQSMAKALAEKSWCIHNLIPHIGANLSARDLFRPAVSPVRHDVETCVIPTAPHKLTVKRHATWIDDIKICDVATGQRLPCVKGSPMAGQYNVKLGVYQFAAEDSGREVAITYSFRTTEEDKPEKLAAKDQKHHLSKLFMSIIDDLPHEHIVHDTAVGLQLPESINEQEWIYLAEGEDKLWCFQNLLNDLFRPFDGVSMGSIDGRADAGAEIKSSMGHMRGYGERITPQHESHYQNLASLKFG